MTELLPASVLTALAALATLSMNCVDWTNWRARLWNVDVTEIIHTLYAAKCLSVNCVEM